MELSLISLLPIASHIILCTISTQIDKKTMHIPDVNLYNESPRKIESEPTTKIYFAGNNQLMNVALELQLDFHGPQHSKGRNRRLVPVHLL